MTHKSFACAFAVLPALISLLAAPAAFAQENLGAGHIEIDSALFGGGLLILPTNQPQPRGYMLDIAIAMNTNRRVGFEGDFAWAMSREATPLNAMAPVRDRTPNMLFYTANVMYNPFGHERRAIPYLELGAGALSVLGGPTTVGLGADTTHLSANVGGGVRLFIIPHWGARADYRYLLIRNAAASVPAGTPPTRHAQRLYGALVLTF